MTNHAIKKIAKSKGVFLWEVAAQLGVSEPTITRWLRFPPNQYLENRILEAIYVIAERKEQEKNECK